MDIINIGKEEELGTIFLKIENSKGKEITLSIPENALILQSVINLKILKKRAEELGKIVSIARVESDKENPKAAWPGLSVSGRSELPNSGNPGMTRPVVVENTSEKKEQGLNQINLGGAEEERMKISSGGGKVRMFDIVKKVESPAKAEKIERVEKTENVGFRMEKNNRVVKNEVVREGRIFSDMRRQPDFSQKADLRVDNISKTRKIVLLPSIISKFFLAFIAVVIIVVLVSAALTLPKVNVNIKLKSHELTSELKLKLDEKADKIDADKGILPAKKEESNGEISESFASTGKKHIVSKASGKITIYNEFSSSDQKIVATTRFLSKDGHIFKIDENVTIPGFSRVEGKDVPGEVSVMVYADKAGEEYNIGPESFTIPGFQGTGKYSTIYARSSAAMTGGADREALYFSESDYIAAKEKLVKVVREKNDQDILAKKTVSYLLLDGTRKEDETKIVTDVKVGDISDSFKMTVSIKESGLFVNKDNIDEIVNWKMSLENNNEEAVGDRTYPDNLSITKAEDGTIDLPINIKQNVVAKVDVDKIKSDLYGKDEQGVKAYFQNIDKFDSVGVTFSWTKNVPSSNDKIDIKIEK